MWIRRMFDWRRSPSEFRGLYPAWRFREAMERERARAARWGQPLSLLSLGVSDARAGEATLRQVARMLRRRRRLTDEAGWLDKRHIGILMPNTPGWGAWTLADDICLDFPQGLALPECRVYTYPSDWFSEQTRISRHVDPSEVDAVEAMDPLFARRLPLWKRGLDILLSALALVVLSPVLFLVAILVRWTSRGPAIFSQVRLGLGGRPFTIYKFRTMVVDAERRKESLRALSQQDGPAFKIPKDPRVTLLGRILRTTSIDELPQLWNVLRGDMSLVGPRPPLPAEVAEYEPWQRSRLDVTPGLTCIWQVEGRSRVSFREWMRMDLRYIRSRSLWQDIKLMVMTLPALIFRRGM